MPTFVFILSYVSKSNSRPGRNIHDYEWERLSGSAGLLLPIGSRKLKVGMWNGSTTAEALPT